MCGKFALVCEYGISNKTETSLDDKKITSEKVIALFIQFYL